MKNINPKDVRYMQAAHVKVGDLLPDGIVMDVQITSEGVFFGLAHSTVHALPHERCAVLAKVSPEVIEAIKEAQEGQRLLNEGDAR